MKKLLLIALLFIGSIAQGSAEAIHIFHDSGRGEDVYANAGIDSLCIKRVGSFEDAYEYCLFTRDGLFRYPVDQVDSIKFNQPYLKALIHQVSVPAQWGCTKIPFTALGSEGAPAAICDGAGSHHIDFGPDYVGDWDYGYVNVIEGVLTAYASSENVEPKEVKWKITDGDMSDEITVRFTGVPLLDDTQFDNVIGVSPEGHQFVYKLSTPGTTFMYEEGDELDWASWHHDAEGNLVVDVDRNDSEDPRLVTLTAVKDNFLKYGFSIKQIQKFKHSGEEHMSALRDFYENTAMSQLDVNWFGDKPLWEWDCCINNDGYGRYWPIKDRIVNMRISDHRVTGTLPPSFEVFMDDVAKGADHNGGDISLSLCRLYGKIPDNIKNNPNWQRLGWNIIPQHRIDGGGFDFEDINLHLDDLTVTDFVNEEEVSNLEVLAKNKITWIFNAGAVDMIDGICDEYVNTYLDYKDKGFGVVATVGGFWDVPYDNYRQYVKEQQEKNGLPKDILWTNGFGNADVGGYYSMSIVDDKGNLLWYTMGYYDESKSYYTQQVDSVCRKYLGEPIEHDPYVSDLYESSDFSSDGEVVTLQQAEIGRGIDLVLTGDAFVDTDFENGGAFYSVMNEAMEAFFAHEPYRALRNRFNVYAVKAVSKNNYRGRDHVFNYDNGKVFEYVAKVSGIDMDNVTVAVINHNPNAQMFASGYTEMFTSGASIAYIESGGVTLIAHEAGGHGFAKLLDEYISPGYEDNVIEDGAVDDFKEWIKSEYHDRGWGTNVSTSDDPQLAPWREFIDDERYAGVVGIFKGAWMWPENLWRSTENSMMNNDYSSFNVQARKVIYERAMKLSEGDDWAYDHDAFVEFDKTSVDNVRTPSEKVAKKHDPVIIHKPSRIIGDDGKERRFDEPRRTLGGSERQAGRKVRTLVKRDRSIITVCSEK